MENYSSSDKNAFLLRVYFDLSEGYINAAIKRAYRDFNRTLLNFPRNKTTKILIRSNWNSVIKKSIVDITTTEFINQEEFCLWHQKTCFQLRTANEYRLTQGQAQKWINMTLKYLYVMGEKYIPGINLNYKYFHIPIDNIIQNKLVLFGVPKFKQPWSTIIDYDSYHKYQKAVKDSFPERIVMDVEFELFNQI